MRIKILEIIKPSRPFGDTFVVIELIDVPPSYIDCIGATLRLHDNVYESRLTDEIIERWLYMQIIDEQTTMELSSELGGGCFVGCDCINSPRIDSIGRRCDALE